ncbi:hypothetical protein ACGYKB_13710 [Sulfitobacter sp. 916]|uniref:hypothetical protein n=1 Tax=Sulfitobacter sp. 916 TaxID=3368559 RepID=UPI0037451336
MDLFAPTEESFFPRHDENTLTTSNGLKDPLQITQKLPRSGSFRGFSNSLIQGLNSFLKTKSYGVL